MEARGCCPHYAAINAGKDIAFVNKEVMVMCGPIVMDAVQKNGVNLIPIDGEMSAIFQCLEGARDRQADIHRLILTASGGPFRDTPKDDLYTVTPQASTSSSQLGYGSENYNRFRYHDEQRTGGY